MGRSKVREGAYEGCEISRGSGGLILDDLNISLNRDTIADYVFLYTKDKLSRKKTLGDIAKAALGGGLPGRIPTNEYAYLDITWKDGRKSNIRLSEGKYEIFRRIMG